MIPLDSQFCRNCGRWSAKDGLITHVARCPTRFLSVATQSEAMGSLSDDEQERVKAVATAVAEDLDSRFDLTLWATWCYVALGEGAQGPQLGFDEDVEGTTIQQRLEHAEQMVNIE